MAVFKVHRVKKEAVVFFPDGTNLEGRFFVSPISPGSNRSEYVSEIITGARRYVPFEMRNGETILLHTGNILKVLLKEREDEYFVNTTREVVVRVSFLSGQEVSGTIRFNMPETHSRLSDFLNQGQEFFTFETDTGIFLINNKFVKSITPFWPVS